MLAISKESYVYKIALIINSSDNVIVNDARHLLNNPAVGNVLLVDADSDTFMMTKAEYKQSKKIAKMLKKT